MIDSGTKKTTKEYGHMFQFNNTPIPYTSNYKKKACLT